MATIGVGIIGTGYWGEKLLRVFGALNEASVRAICDTHAGRRASAGKNVATFSSAADLLDQADIDAVLVATPPSTHYALARQVLAAGKHCWVEKPLAMRAEEARTLVDLATRQARTLFVDETFLYDPLLQTAKQWITAGRLGKLFHLSFERLGQGRIRRDSNVWWNSAPHDLAILCYLVPGAIEAVHVESFAYVQAGIADYAAGTVRLSGGVSAHLYLSWLSPLKVASIVVVGSDAMLHYEGRFGKRALTLYDYRLADPSMMSDNVVPFEDFSVAESIAGGNEEPLGIAAAAFVESIRSGVPAPSAGVYSQRVVELLERAAS